MKWWHTLPLYHVNWSLLSGVKGMGVIMTVWPQAVCMQRISEAASSIKCHTLSLFIYKNINSIIVIRLDTWKSGLYLLFRGYTKTEAAVGQEHEWVRGQTVLCRVKQRSESLCFGLKHTSTHTRTVIIGKAWLLHGPCVCECACCPSEVK